jgi:hypothetical protein
MQQILTGMKLLTSENIWRGTNILFLPVIKFEFATGNKNILQRGIHNVASAICYIWSSSS